jgi:hypothetical protein
MFIQVKRTDYSDKATIGELYVDGVFECYTLEDVVRSDGVKIFGETAIPPGTYAVGMTWSKRFGRIMPQIMDVPGFEGIRIHPGNSDKDTEGCILVGKTKNPPNWIGESVAAFNPLYAKMQHAWSDGSPITLEIV